MKATDLDTYLTNYGALLGKQAEEVLDPLHVPGRDELPDLTRYLRTPFPAQAHVIAATVKNLKANRAELMCAKQGTGKTLMSGISLDLLSGGRPYRALVMCPGHLVHKWRRELENTLPGIETDILESCHQLNRWYERKHVAPTRPEWLIVGRDRVKLGSLWEAAWVEYEPRVVRRGGPLLRLRQGLLCPRCGGQLKDKDGNLADLEWLQKAQRSCPCPVWRWVTKEGADGAAVRQLGQVECGERLWQHVGPQKGKLNRFEPARYIHRRLRRFFDYFVCDEVHEEKSSTSAQGEAFGCLAASCRSTLALTGTLIGGKANHVRPILFRLIPGTLVREGLVWNNPGAFDRRYGRIEKVISEQVCPPTVTARQSRGKSRTTTETVRPGVMPTLFGRHLLGSSVYLELNEVADNLPPMRDGGADMIKAVDMDAELAAEYSRVSGELTTVNSKLVAQGKRGLLSAMLQCLLAYPDYPQDWGPVGYWEREPGQRPRFVPVVQPKDLGPRPRAKEKELLALVKREVAEGRQVWVYVQYTDKHDVLGRLVDVFQNAGVDAVAMRSSIGVEKREKWIADKGGRHDVVVSHPGLVKTGLDLFLRKERGGYHYNFSTLVWYETGYDAYTLPQASARGWRIGQEYECRVYYLFYAQTAQDAAMALMGKKLAAAQALEGRFSSEGLAAMGGDDVSVEMALAQSLDKLLPDETARVWGTIRSAGGGREAAKPEAVGAGLAGLDADLDGLDTEGILSELGRYEDGLDDDGEDELDLAQLAELADEMERRLDL